MKTTFRAAQDQFDADTIHVGIRPGCDDDWDDDWRVYCYLGHDGVPVVQIDTSEEWSGRLRINLNDGAIWDGNPERDEAPGSFFKKS